METNQITEIIRDMSFSIFAGHEKLKLERVGPGLLESVYQQVLGHRLVLRGLDVQYEVSIPVEVDGVAYEQGFRADLLVQRRVIVEVKACAALVEEHRQQLYTQMRFARIGVGILVNFGAAMMRGNYERQVLGSDVPLLKPWRKPA